MKTLNKTLVIALLSVAMIMPTGCQTMQQTMNNMNNTGKDAVVGGGVGAAVGTGVGALIGGGKGAWIGALVGSAVGAGTGALVGNQMDKQKKELEQQLSSVQALANNNAYTLQTVKDRNNLDAIRLVLGNSILFKTGSYQLSADAQAALSKIAYNLKQFPNTDVTVVGYTDNTGGEQLNMTLSKQRADACVNYLVSMGVNPSRLKAVGNGWNDPIASNATAEGRAQNRRVEFYITADEQMINNANAAN